MRTFLAFVGTTLGSIAFQVTVTFYPAQLQPYAHWVKWAWVAWALIWLTWLASHPSIFGNVLGAKKLAATPAPQSPQSIDISPTISPVFAPVFNNYPVTPARDTMNRIVAEMDRRRHDSAASEVQKPNLVVWTAVYQMLDLGADHVWRSGSKYRGLVVKVRNDPNEDGKGVKAINVRAQTIFEGDTGAQGPIFSPVPWLGEKYGIIDIPVLADKQLLIGIKVGAGGSGGGWTGYQTSRLSPECDRETDVMNGHDLVDNGKITLKIISEVDGQSQVIHESQGSWNIDFALNHPSFTLVSKPQAK